LQHLFCDRPRKHFLDANHPDPHPGHDSPDERNL
jgi:hypothetical protein